MSTTFTKNITYSAYNAFNPQFGGSASSFFAWRGWNAEKYNNQYGFAGVNSSGSRAAFVFRFSTPTWSGDVSKLTLSFKILEELGRNRTVRVSVTTTDPTTSTTLYTGQTLPTDGGRIAETVLTVAASSENTYTIEIPSTSIPKNRTMYLVISPNTTASGTSNYVTIHTISFSGYVTYDADATQVSANNGYIGSALAISMTNDGMSHVLTYSFEGATGSIGTTTGSTLNWTPPNSLMSRIPSATTGTCRITCTTEAGSTYCDITLYVPESVKPTISLARLTAINDNPTVAAWGIWLQGYTKARAELTAIANYSNIVAYRIDCGAVVFTESGLSTDLLTVDETSAVLTVPGTYSFSVTVTDARGRTATATASSTYTVRAYASPSVENVEVYRCTSDGTRDDKNGTYLRAYAKAVYSAVGGNAITEFSFQYKERTQSETQYVTVPMQDQTALITGGGNIDVLKSYNARIYIEDYLGGSYINVVISTQSVAFNLKPSSDSGAGFGGYAQDDKILELFNGWKLRVQSDEHILVYSNGTIKTLKQLIAAGGGGGGTTDYNDLDNRPSINGVTLSGNKQASDLDLESISNKVTSISSASTDTQYPSAKCVYDIVGDIESALAALR